MRDLTPVPSMFEPVPPTHVHADGRRTWWLTEQTSVTIYPEIHPHPFGYVVVRDRSHQRLDSRCLQVRDAAEVYLTPPRPDVA